MKLLVHKQLAYKVANDLRFSTDFPFFMPVFNPDINKVQSPRKPGTILGEAVDRPHLNSFARSQELQFGLELQLTVFGH